MEKIARLVLPVITVLLSCSAEGEIELPTFGHSGNNMQPIAGNPQDQARNLVDNSHHMREFLNNLQTALNQLQTAETELNNARDDNGNLNVDHQSFELAWNALYELNNTLGILQLDLSSLGDVLVNRNAAVQQAGREYIENNYQRFLTNLNLRRNTISESIDHVRQDAAAEARAERVANGGETTLQKLWRKFPEAAARLQAEGHLNHLQ